MSEIQSEVIVVEVPRDTLIPNPYNPNQQSLADFELLVKSIEEDGFTLPVVVNDGSKDASLKNMIVDGEHRWRAAGVLGMPTVPVVYKAMNQSEMRASTIRHNTARGHHDANMEATLIQDLSSTLSVEEIGAQLNIDPVELDMLTHMAHDTASLKEVALTIEEEVIQGLMNDGLPEQEARVVGGRHAMIQAKEVLTAEDRETSRLEAGKSVRVEFVFSGEQADFVRKFVQKHKTPLNALLFVLKHIEGKAG